jgi:hypothetical protein
MKIYLIGIIPIFIIVILIIGIHVKSTTGRRRYLLFNNK